ncbi:hypothetical protein J6590_086039 [Homalodisca vitripennis]|nr:hypothetical protein J6590_086039 [Homalodisca vitripennis]
MAANGFLSCIDQFTREEIRQDRVVQSLIDHIYLRADKIRARLLPTALSDRGYRLYAGNGFSCVQELIEKYDPIVKDTVK